MVAIAGAVIAITGAVVALACAVVAVACAVVAVTGAISSSSLSGTYNRVPCVGIDHRTNSDASVWVNHDISWGCPDVVVRSATDRNPICGCGVYH